MDALCPKMMTSDVLAPGFWEVGAYKHNVKRIKDGTDQLDDYSKMIRERADIEAKYSKSLQQFAERWRVHVDRTISAGCVKTSWTELLSEADALSQQHGTVKEKLLEGIMKDLSRFKKDNHHPSMLRGPKEIREIEDSFEKAQREWKKLHEKLESAKKSYYSSCRQEKSALVNLSNSQADSSVSQDGHQKFRDRHERCKEEVHKTKVQYEKRISDITQYRNAYVEGMTFVFDRCQQQELKRAKFFLEIASGTHQVLAGLVRNQAFINLHNQLESLITGMDDGTIQSDLQQWSQVNGAEAATVWPAFEEYTPELRNLSNSRSAPMKGGEVVLTRQIIRSDEIPNTPGPASSGSDHGKGSSDSDTNTFDSRKNDRSSAINDKKWSERVITESPPISIPTPDSAKYGDFDDFPTTHVVKSNATVLYDYAPVENDEIALKKGETIEILSEPDSLGWCTGRNHGEVGLFPASYVQVI